MKVEIIIILVFLTVLTAMSIAVNSLRAKKKKAEEEKKLQNKLNKARQETAKKQKTLDEMTDKEIEKEWRKK